MCLSFLNTEVDLFSSFEDTAILSICQFRGILRSTTMCSSFLFKTFLNTEINLFSSFEDTAIINYYLYIINFRI